MSSLQYAIDSASEGDEIWLAGGTYSPTKIRCADTPCGTAVSFDLKDGVSIHGGFSGVETSLAERAKASSYPWDFKNKTILASSPETYGNILYTDCDLFRRRTVFSGLTIRNGSALGSGRDGIGGCAIIPGNTIIEDSVIENGKAFYGGGIATTGNATVTRCLITSNEALEHSGGILCQNHGTLIEKSLIMKNFSNYGCAGIKSGKNCNVNFCTIVRNHGKGDSGGIDISDGRISSCIIWGNIGSIQQICPGNAEITNCAIEGVAIGNNGIALAHNNNGPGGPAANDNAIGNYYACFSNPDIGDFTLGAGSYAINRGELSLNCNNGILPDIGAFESPFKGNIAADFEIQQPCIYKKNSVITLLTGPLTPQLDTKYISDKAVIGKRDAFWMQSGSAVVTLIANSDDKHWNALKLSRNIIVSKRTLLIAADDKYFMPGRKLPPLTYTIVSGSLAPGDKITGKLSCTAGTSPGTYPINRGSLAIDAISDGDNYIIVFLEGEMSSH